MEVKEFKKAYSDVDFPLPILDKNGMRITPTPWIRLRRDDIQFLIHFLNATDEALKVLEEQENK